MSPEQYNVWKTCLRPRQRVQVFLLYYGFIAKKVYKYCAFKFWRLDKWFALPPKSSTNTTKLSPNHLNHTQVHTHGLRLYRATDWRKVRKYTQKKSELTYWKRERKVSTAAAWMLQAWNQRESLLCSVSNLFGNRCLVSASEWLDTTLPGDE